MYTTNVLQLHLPRFIRNIKVVRGTKSYYGSNGNFEDLQETTHYVNRTGKPVFIYTRNGVRYRINNTIREQPPGLIVIKKVKMRRSGLVDYDHRNMAAKHPPSQESLMVNNLLKIAPDDNGHGAYREVLSIEYFIPLEMIQQNINGIYITELDINVGISDETVTDHQNIVHPFSEFASTKIMEHNYSKLRDGLEGIPPFGFLIVDHDVDFAPRYIRLGENVYRIPTSTDKRLEEGFYVSTPKPYRQRSEHELMDHRILTMEEADKEFRLATRFEDAMMQDSLLTNDIKFTELNLRNKQADLTQEELDYKRDNLRLMQELEVQKREYEETKRKHDFDMREYSRRKERRLEWLDVAKTGLGFVTTGFLIYKAFKYK